MNTSVNYYAVLGITNNATPKEIKVSYYNLSKTHHPDKGGDEEVFAKIAEAYTILTDNKEEYDRKSKFGKDYDETLELYDMDVNFDYQKTKEKFDKAKDEHLDIYVEINEDFNGSIEYERWKVCGSCDGSGKDMSSKIKIMGADGSFKYFEADDGCDFCEGSGKDWRGNDCSYCRGKGKVGMTPCQKCVDGRVKGKEKVSGIKLEEGDKTKLEFFGNYSVKSPGKVGNLYLLKPIL